ncbi:DUF2066 domain-containing protein [Phyllobacterium sp. BT25]|uniref:DUF2066 domain-containing protein n=1 Tax=Phyllobacterium pellucidum TaxID=2740464 RepID=A0A849VP94_9HYPH|nr:MULTISPECIES: DUF2066 domain-containing protein [Phyllobacterium]NTS30854.1 DUF2066 domain-containing protein [Phyllobacterium pellucidum]SFI63738.1 hypothetical protein SAMN04515648_0902 [Phyllobacterium sp. CL33Tsu]
MFRQWSPIGLFLTVMLACGAAPAANGDLYQASAVVSGQGEAGRSIGLAQTFEDVLVKVSGDPRLMGDPKIAALKQQAAQFVATYQYRDRMSGVPIHDEQGTYDRPHDLTVSFDPARIDALLHSLGRKAWLDPRPRIVVFLDVVGRKERFALAEDGSKEPDMRSSLAAAARKVGLPVALPTVAQLTKYELNAETLPSADLSVSDAAARNAGGDVALAGDLRWSDSALGWIADWRIDYRGTPFRWQIKGVGFDDAFRNGMRGAAQILSGNGPP